MPVALATPIRLIRDPAFAKRLQSAAELHPHCPPLHRGRLGWIKDKLAEMGEQVSTETVRKWLEGEAKPRQEKGKMLAQIFEVDAAWLQMGQDAKMDVRERRVRNAMADGAVNLVAGLIQMDGGFPAFPDKDSTVDLHAIIKGAKYDFHIALAKTHGRAYEFQIPTDHQQTVVLGVVRDGFKFDVFEISPEVIEEHGKRHGGSIEVSVTPPKLNRIKSFSRRL